MKKKALFVCTHNSARSQMAEGLLSSLYGDRFEAFSAGTKPSHVNPFAVKAMAEIGIDISAHCSKGFDQFYNAGIDYVITVCDNANESCPVFPGAGKRLHNSFADPSAVNGSDEDKLAAFRRTRDEIKEWIQSSFA